MQTGRKYRLYPSGEQAAILSNWIGCVRHVYNQKVEEDIYLMWLRTWSKFSPSYTGPEGPEPTKGIVNQRCAHLKKKDAPWIWQTPHQIYRNCMSQYFQAWANRFKNSAHFGRPEKRVKGQNDSILLTRELFSIENDRIVIKGKKSEPVGSIFFQKHRACGTPNQMTISQDTLGRWFVSFSFEDGVKPSDQKEIFETIRESKNPRALVEGFDRGVDNPVWGSKLGNIPMPENKKNERIKKYIKSLNLLFKFSRFEGFGSFKIINRRMVKEMNKKTYLFCMCIDGGTSLDVLCEVVNQENLARTPSKSPVRITVRQVVSEEQGKER
jgi:putative transposase